MSEEKYYLNVGIPIKEIFLTNAFTIPFCKWEPTCDFGLLLLLLVSLIVRRRKGNNIGNITVPYDATNIPLFANEIGYTVIGYFNPLTCDIVRPVFLDIPDSGKICWVHEYTHAIMETIQHLLVDAFFTGGPARYKIYYDFYKPYVEAFGEAASIILFPKLREKYLKSYRNNELNFRIVRAIEKLQKYVVREWHWDSEDIRFLILIIIQGLASQILKVPHKILSTNKDTTIIKHSIKKPFINPSIIELLQIIEQSNLPTNLTFEELWRYLHKNLINKIGIHLSWEPHHESIERAILCLSMSQRRPESFFFSALRFAARVPIVRDFSVEGDLLRCPFSRICIALSEPPVLGYLKKLEEISWKDPSCFLIDVSILEDSYLQRTTPRKKPISCYGEFDTRCMMERGEDIATSILNFIEVLETIISKKKINCLYCKRLLLTLQEFGFSINRLQKLSNLLETNLPYFLRIALSPPQRYRRTMIQPVYEKIISCKDEIRNIFSELSKELPKRRRRWIILVPWGNMKITSTFLRLLEAKKIGEMKFKEVIFQVWR
jgi:hypothetical protein